jgi:hypothetical protein
MTVPLTSRRRSSRRSAAESSTTCPAPKPIEDLGTHHDPGLVDQAQDPVGEPGGLGPPRTRLRVEHAEMAERLDDLTREADA